MSNVALWQVGAGSLERVPEVALDLESTLESWIETTPALIQSDLVIVGRQLKTEAGRIDLLGLDAQGRWLVIEVKRAVLSRDAVAQVLDYASLLVSLDAEALAELTNAYLEPRGKSIEGLLQERDAMESLSVQPREVLLVIVGTGRAAGLDRVVQYLSDRYGVPISVVTLDVFELPAGPRLISREVLEAEDLADSERQRTRISPDDVIALARGAGLGEGFEAIYRAAIELGLYPRTWKTSIMYASPKKRTNMLFTVWARPTDGKLRLSVWHQGFHDFYGFSVEQVAQYLGPEGDRFFTVADAHEFAEKLRALFAALAPQAQEGQAAADKPRLASKTETGGSGTESDGTLPN
ncbi:MAG TPA: endonuclease NucS domain-containing protein [Polyangiaceae bacterium]|nr:endonuclease NucS domain-containing protein [Polyangiaceae bacterium]